MVMRPRVAIVVQSRMSSSRQPAKAMLDLCGKTLLERVLDRCRMAAGVDEFWLATSTAASDDPIAWTACERGWLVHRGPLDDVLERFCQVLDRSSVDILVRVTADNALTEPRFVEVGLQALAAKNCDYVAFHDVPYGSSVELVSRGALLRCRSEGILPEDREHVTYYIVRNPGLFRIVSIPCPIPAVAKTAARVTLDTLDDYLRLYRLFYHYRGRGEVTLEEAVRFLSNAELAAESAQSGQAGPEDSRDGRNPATIPSGDQ